MKSRDAEHLVASLECNDFKKWSSTFKTSAWDKLRNAKLTQAQKYRLRKVAIQYLYYPIASEFSHMPKFIRTISDDSFRLQVKHLTTAKVFELRERAALLLVYLDNPD